MLFCLQACILGTAEGTKSTLCCLRGRARFLKCLDTFDLTQLGRHRDQLYRFVRATHCLQSSAVEALQLLLRAFCLQTRLFQADGSCRPGVLRNVDVSPVCILIDVTDFDVFVASADSVRVAHDLCFVRQLAFLWQKLVLKSVLWPGQKLSSADAACCEIRLNFRRVDLLLCFAIVSMVSFLRVFERCSCAVAVKNCSEPVDHFFVFHEGAPELQNERLCFVWKHFIERHKRLSGVLSALWRCVFKTWLEKVFERQPVFIRLWAISEQLTALGRLWLTVVLMQFWDQRLRRVLGGACRTNRCSLALQ